MSANTEIIETAYGAFARGDIAGVMELVADDVTWSTPKTLPQGGHYQGKDGVLQFFQAVGGSWSDLALKVEAVTDAGTDLVIGLIHGDGTLGTGTASGYGATHVFTIEAGGSSNSGSTQTSTPPSADRRCPGTAEYQGVPSSVGP